MALRSEEEGNFLLEEQEHRQQEQQEQEQQEQEQAQKHFLVVSRRAGLGTKGHCTRTVSLPRPS